MLSIEERTRTLGTVHRVRKQKISRPGAKGGVCKHTRDSRGPRLPRADLLLRVFAVEALACPRCGHPMCVLAAIQSPDAIRAILECLGLSALPPPVAPPPISLRLPDELPES